MKRLFRATTTRFFSTHHEFAPPPPPKVVTMSTFPPPKEFQEKARINSREQYERMWKESIENPDKFWSEIAKEFSWFKPFSKAYLGGFEKFPIRWFEDGQLNITVNCLDRHIATKGDQVAIIFEADNGESQTYTYKQVLDEVSKIGNVLRAHGVKKGDNVTVFMPMIPELAFTILACARIGAVHSVVFSGFSSHGLCTRLVDAKSSTMVTTDIAVRGGKIQHVKEIAEEGVALAAKEGVNVSNVFILTNNIHDPLRKSKLELKKHEISMNEECKKASNVCTPEVMNSEDPLFILYTSGSTGKPKGVVHTIAGYMVYAATTFKYLFDIRPETDVHFCTADIGWVTGHTYIVYAPLLNATKSVLFEGIPTHPHPGRMWEIVAKHQVSLFYTAPTALRALIAHGDAHVAKFDRSSLRLLGSVGEPINEAAWLWYYNIVGEKRCPIIDTWWQTETGGALLSPFPGADNIKPTAAMTPFFGVKMEIVDNEGVEVANGVSGQLCITQPWPSIMRTLFNDNDRYISSYFTDFPGKYFTGDGAFKDSDGHYRIIGRLDDVMNISGHRISTAEIECAMSKHSSVAEVAAVSVAHPIKGEALYCYVTLRHGIEGNETTSTDIKHLIREEIGPIASPDFIHFTHSLPKTRSGKIMRRILRKIANNDITNLGDISTLSDPHIVQELIDGRKNIPK